MRPLSGERWIGSDRIGSDTGPELAVAAMSQIEMRSSSYICRPTYDALRVSVRTAVCSLGQFSALSARDNGRSSFERIRDANANPVRRHGPVLYRLRSSH